MNKKLDIQLLRVISEITEKLRRFENLERMAFDADVNNAFCYSTKLAIEVGVDAEKVLINKHDIDNFFLN